VFQVLKPTAEADNVLSFSDDEDDGDDDVEGKSPRYIRNQVF